MESRLNISQSPQKVLVAAPGGVPYDIVVNAIRKLEQAYPQAEVTMLDDQEPWGQSAPDQWEWVSRLQRLGFDVAVIIGDGTYSPYPLAYAFYLAGIRTRVGVSAEFGGNALTYQVRPLGPGIYLEPDQLIPKD